ncbi:cytochrome c oxidase subunit 3 family protein [Herbaspirillum sp. HC18]|nr:cytochrome c oxidase subunit 3 family protein [Herbaspirillum sp. HC18]
MSAELAEQFDTPAQQGQAGVLGMWIFLATELMFFGPLFFGYVYGRVHYPEGFAAASRHTSVLLGTINTAVLLTSSLLMAMAVEARKAGTRSAGRLLLAVAALGIVFLVIKGVEYRHEWQEHLFPAAGFSFPEAPHAGAARMFYFLYFAMTGLHALHLVIGISLVGTFGLALGKNALRFAETGRVEIAGLYWHFVDVIWIFLYPILYLVGRNGS